MRVVAALAVIAVGLGLWAYRLHQPRPPLAVNETRPRLAVDWDGFIDEFQRNPGQALSLFITQFDSQQVEVIPDELAGIDKQVRYRTIRANQLPNDFSVDAVYLLKMECCTGVQCVLKRKGSQVLAILQHTIDHPVWYGQRDVQIAEVHGKTTRIVRVNGRLAATWQKDGTYVSLVGAKDMAELTELIASLEGGRKEK